MYIDIYIQVLQISHIYYTEQVPKGVLADVTVPARHNTVVITTNECKLMINEFVNNTAMASMQ